MAARLTIAIPTVNRAALMVRALESALAQTSNEVEIFVSNNGSTDETAAILATYADPRLRIVHRPATVPRAAHGALIFDEVDTEFVLVLSDDDYIAPDFAKAVLALFDRRPDLAFVYTGCFEHYDDAVYPCLVGPEVEDPLSFIAAHYENLRQVAWCACVTRVGDLRRIGPQPADRIIGDMFFWTKIAFQGPIGCVESPLAHYTALRPGGDNESRTTPIAEWTRDVARLQAEVRALVAGHGADASYQARLAGRMRKNLATTTANQFIWARIAGSRRSDCWRAVWSGLPASGWDARSAATVLSALLFPRRILRELVVRSARRRAQTRPGPPAA